MSPENIPVPAQAKHKVTMPELIAKVADMESDIIVAIDVIGRLLDSLGISKAMADGGNINTALPKILSGLTVQMMGGDFDTTAFSDVPQIIPILDKYKNLKKN